jgi:subtilisin family serine protease
MTSSFKLFLVAVFLIFLAVELSILGGNLFNGSILKLNKEEVLAKQNFADTEVMPNEILIKFKEQKNPQEAEKVVLKILSPSSLSEKFATIFSRKGLLGKFERVEKMMRVKNQTLAEMKAEIKKRFPNLTEEELLKEGISAQKAFVLQQEMEKWYLIRFKEKVDVAAAVKLFAKNQEIEKAIPNPLFKLALTPNDPFFHSKGSLSTKRYDDQGNIVTLRPEPPDLDDLWGLKAIKAPEAWEITTGSPNVIIAVIDTGVDYEHPELKDVVLRDIDKGYDFPDQDYNPMDDYSDGRGGHGTHVAGIIAAKTNNSTGISGVCWNCKIMAIKIFKYFKNDPQTGLPIDDHVTTLDWLVNGIKYAADHGAHIVNMSFGGYTVYSEEMGAIDYIVSKGVIPVASAGNGRETGGQRKSVFTFLATPANHPQVISVGSVKSVNGEIKPSGFSNFGPKTDAWAPGSWILSLRANNTDMYSKNPSYVKGSSIVQDKYYIAQGTSMAAPYVSGIVGLMKSVNPNLTPWQAMEIIHSADDGPLIDGVSNGLINARKAVEMAQNPPPFNNPPAKPTLEIPSEVFRGKIATFRISNIQDQESNKISVGVAWVAGEGCVPPWAYRDCGVDDAFDQMIFPNVNKGSSVTFQRKFAVDTAYAAYLVAIDEKGKSSEIAGPFRVLVKDLPLIVGLSAKPQSVSPGQEVLLSWRIREADQGFNFDSCQASSTDGKWSGSKNPAGGFEKIYPDKSATYTLTCQGPYGAFDSVSVHVEVVGAPSTPLSLKPVVLGNYYVGQEITFKAYPSGGTGQYSYQWSGACEGEEQECKIIPELPGVYIADVWVISGSERAKDTQRANVLSLPLTNKYNLSVLKQGEGIISGPGINCGSDCNEQYNAGSSVTLSATPASGYTFDKWQGCDSVSGTNCNLTMNSDKVVTAYFKSTINQPSGTLSCGSVTSSSIILNYSFQNGTNTSLFRGSTFLINLGSGNRSGSYTDTGLPANTTYTYYLRNGTSSSSTLLAQATCSTSGSNQYTLTVQKSGGTGLVISDDPITDINCGSDCTGNYSRGTVVGLMAIPDPGYQFDRWSSNCTPINYYPYICTVTMDSNKTVTAYFRK